MTYGANEAIKDLDSLFRLIDPPVAESMVAIGRLHTLLDTRVRRLDAMPSDIEGSINYTVGAYARDRLSGVDWSPETLRATLVSLADLARCCHD